ncbi:MAG: PQQ-binding-like beta-propeller repeat protein [Saprospiraceae bacterium]|nr:PQQ-binding-like beta-propeller repeat protein [Saprospiraceae bacterium]
MSTRCHLLFSACILVFFSCKKIEPDPAVGDWPHYQGDPGSNQYSDLAEINKSNIQNLRVAWTYHSGDADSLNRSQIQCNPLIIDGVLYGTNPKLKLFALDASTGSEKWVFDPFAGGYNMYGMGVNRGLAYWTDGQKRRIYFCAGSFIHAVNAADGSLVASFGDGGRVDIRTGLGERAQKDFVVANSPGVIFKNLFIVGTRVSEAMGAAPGYIRAFDVNSGELKWVFHTIPQPGEEGYETWPDGVWKDMGGANGWSGMSVDHERGMVFVPTGSAAYDFYGGDRHGENLLQTVSWLLTLRPAKESGISKQ